MIYKGKYKIIDNLITSCDYEYLLIRIKENIKNKKPLLISPLASHTLVRAKFNKKLKLILDKFDYLVPDSYWVKWSLGFLYGKKAKLKNRVYGPELMLKICKLASENKFKIFLYGNKKEVLLRLEKKLKNLFPTLTIVDKEESKFRKLKKKEWETLVNKITKKKPNIIFICLGSPKQEIFSYKLSKKLGLPTVIIPVGAAFDFISGAKPQAPKWMQNIGLEWLFRLIKEPSRLVIRYLFYSPLFLLLVIIAKVRKLFS